jgi:hypothetical protein
VSWLHSCELVALSKRSMRKVEHAYYAAKHTGTVRSKPTGGAHPCFKLGKSPQWSKLPHRTLSQLQDFFSLAHRALKASTWVCCSTSLGGASQWLSSKTHCTVQPDAQLYSSCSGGDPTGEASSRDSSTWCCVVHSPTVHAQA